MCVCACVCIHTHTYIDTGHTQEEIFSHYKASTHQMMYYTNVWAMVLLSVAMLITGDGTRALGFVAKNPAVLSKIFQFGLMSACGQFFIFFLVRDTRAHAQTHTHTHAHTHAHAHARTQAHTCAHAQTYTHTRVCVFVVRVSPHASVRTL